MFKITSKARILGRNEASPCNKQTSSQVLFLQCWENLWFDLEGYGDVHSKEIKSTVSGQYDVPIQSR